jgi:hypothetical protein
MNPVRSSLAAGVVATAVLAAVLFVADALVVAPRSFVFATFASLCAVGGPPYCAVGTATARALTFGWFVVLFAVGWPLFFGAFTWGIPGESGRLHGAVFGVFLWAGHAGGIALIGLAFPGRTVETSLSLFLATLAAYLVYGLVLGSVYDRLAAHRTLLDAEPAPG